MLNTMTITPNRRRAIKIISKIYEKQKVSRKKLILVQTLEHKCRYIMKLYVKNRKSKIYKSKISSKKWNKETFKKDRYTKQRSN